MQRHRELYKEQSLAFSPRNFNEQNRELQNAARAKQREDRFQSNRIISVSPTPVKRAAPIPPSEEPQPRLTYVAPHKENRKPELPQQQRNPTRDLYIKRFVDWKAARKEQTKNEQIARRGQKMLTYKTETLKPATNPQKEQENAPAFVPPKRHSLYVLAKKTQCTQTAAERKQPLATQLRTQGHPSRLRAQPAATMAKLQHAASRLQPVTVKTQTSNMKHQTSARNVQPATVKPAPSRALPLKPTAGPKPKAADLVVGPSANGVVHLPNVRTQPFEKPAVSKPTLKIPAVKPKPIQGGGGGGAAGKFKSTAVAKGPAIQNKLASQLSTRMKAKSNVSKYVGLQKNVRNRPELMRELVEAGTTELPLPPNTPLEEKISFPALATFTQCKTNNCSQEMIEALGEISNLSPVGPMSRHRDSKAKRKFDFSRYSLIKTAAEESLILDPYLAKDPDDKEQENSTLKAAAEQTPPRRISDEKPNYLSPYVSVSRGKVNSRCDREKPNSMYLPGEEYPVANRRALRSGLYFRIQLENEIRRLRDICSEWEAYSKENEAHLVETGGIDMINVAIGQTNLLSTKKLMQFSGLIDRCEAGATGKNHRPYDGSEETKPVQAEDLEGWWDMLRLQSENVDKRFDNLKRWKQNNWQDPDAVEESKIPAKPVAKPKSKLGNNLNAKPKVKASSNLMQLLRKAHAEMKKANADVVSADDAPQTPSRSSTQRVIVVRDRRSFSPARTVLRMSVGESRSSNGGNTLLKSAILAAAEQNALNHTPPPNKGRQSILKKPGTSKRESRGVIFSTKKNVRHFKFTYEEGTISDDEPFGGDKLEDCEEDMSIEASGETRSVDQGPAENEPQSAS
ncbi:guanylate kinase-associated protein mars-like [Drosophila miranda]|uniref:guanylate kinase-associated protein mars-like n=1 Tax=Drosophila miranda TaxID=7229 RepID=UPI00143F2AA7|nr:guanylate kinase-associated protein mars-like [Drosophila miranda]